MATASRFLAKNGLDANSKTIINLLDPVNATDAVTKQWAANASNLSSGTISSSILGNSTVYIGTTAIALNRSSAAQALTGITSIDGTAVNATNTTITDDTTTNASMYLTWVTANTGNLPQKTTSTKLTFNPSTGTLTATAFSGSGASLTSLTAGNLSGTIPSAVLGNSTVYIGTTAIALNRASASQALTGITSIDGSAAKLTTARTISLTGDVTGSVSFDGSSNVSISATLTNASVTGEALTGYVVGANTALAATDTILGAFGKVQGQINAMTSGTGMVTSFNTRTGAITLTSSDVTTALTYTPVNKAGDSMSNDLSFTGSTPLYLGYSYGIRILATASGGWARGFIARDNANTTDLGVFGIYGTAGTINYHYIGGSYSSPLFKLDPNGNGTFAGSTVTVTSSVNGTLGFTANNTSNGTNADSRYTLKNDASNQFVTIFGSSGNTGTFFTNSRANAIFIGSGSAGITSISIGALNSSANIPIVFGSASNEVARFTSGTLASGSFTVNYTTASTSTTTGSAIFSGGIGVAGAVYAASFNGSGAGLTSIPNSALTNSSITIGTTSISLGGTSTSLNGLSAITIDPLTGSANATLTLTGRNAGVGNSATILANWTGGLVFTPVSGQGSYFNGAVTVTGNYITSNSNYLYWADSGSTNRRIFGLNSSNQVFVGPVDSGWGDNTYIRAGKSIVFGIDGATSLSNILSLTSGNTISLGVTNTVTTYNGSTFNFGTANISETFIAGSTGITKYRNVGSYQNRASNIYGNIIIQLPYQAAPTTMLSIKIKGYDYSTKGSWECLISGYVYSTGTSGWTNYAVRGLGWLPFDTVRFAFQGFKSTGPISIAIDGTAKTFTRTTGSFITDGFAVGQYIQLLSEYSANSGTLNTDIYVISSITDLVITCASQGPATTEAATTRILTSVTSTGTPTVWLYNSNPGNGYQYPEIIIDEVIASYNNAATSNWNTDWTVLRYYYAKASATANVTISNPDTSTFDGVTVNTGDRVLLPFQTTASECGLYIFNGSSSAMTRSIEANTAAGLSQAYVSVDKGNTLIGNIYQFPTITTLGTDSATPTFIAYGYVPYSITPTTLSAVQNDTTTNATYYPMFAESTNSSPVVGISSSKLTYNPSTGTLTATAFSGSGTGLTGTLIFKGEFPTANNQDFNSITAQGHYDIVTGNFTGTANSPTNAYGTMLVLGQTNFFTQIYDDYTSSRTFIRNYYQPQGWHAWRELITSSNIASQYVAGISGFNTPSTSGANGLTWPHLTAVKADGVMEIGKYLDFHDASNDGLDYSIRIYSNAGVLNTPGISSSGHISCNSLASSTSITGASIWASARMFAGGTSYSPATGTTVTIDCSVGNTFIINLPTSGTGVIFGTPSNPANYQVVNVIFIQGSTTASTITWPNSSVMKWASNSTKNIDTTTAGAISMLSMIYTGSYWLVTSAKDFS